MQNPRLILQSSQVHILDFSYPRETMLELIQKHRVTVLDHHETAQASIGDLPGCHFDIGHSGAVLAWEHFHPGKPMPQLLSYVEDRDLWKWEMENSREVNRAIMSYDMDFGVWDELIYGGHEEEYPMRVNLLAIEGESILRDQVRTLERILSGVVTRELDGWNVPDVNTPILASEACEALLELNPDAPFAAAWHENSSGRKWSLRSRNDGPIDVGDVARRLGGGGHVHAAGFLEKTA